MYFEEFELGFQMQLEPANINKQDMVDFAKKYDNIPLHTNEEYAKTTFFGKLIAPGVMSFMSVWSKYFGGGFGRRRAACRQVYQN